MRTRFCLGHRGGGGGVESRLTFIYLALTSLLTKSFDHAAAAAAVYEYDYFYNEYSDARLSVRALLCSFVSALWRTNWPAAAAVSRASLQADAYEKLVFILANYIYGCLEIYYDDQKKIKIHYCL